MSCSLTVIGSVIKEGVFITNGLALSGSGSNEVIFWEVEQQNSIVKYNK
jgi:hypothetical protein